jgi:hypothetical protein
MEAASGGEAFVKAEDSGSHARPFAGIPPFGAGSCPNIED